MAPKPVLAYWDVRGRAGPIRLMLTYLNVDFEDKRYKLGPGHDKAEWLKEKFSHGLDFPNLPYYIDGDVKLTQTLAILRYLARKYKLDGSTEVARTRIDLLEQQITDNWMAAMMFIYKKETPTEAEKVEFLGNVDKQLEAISKFLGSNQFVGGNEISYVDFWFYEYLYNVETTEVTKGRVTKHANLAGYLKRFEALPQVAGYLKKVNAN